MNKETALNLIKIAEKNMNGEDVDFIITEEMELDDDVTLFLFENEYCKSTAIGYSDGLLFVTGDWQQSTRPESLDEIEKYDWFTVDWRRAVIFDKLPRVLM